MMKRTHAPTPTGRYKDVSIPFILNFFQPVLSAVHKYKYSYTSSNKQYMHPHIQANIVTPKLVKG